MTPQVLPRTRAPTSTYHLFYLEPIIDRHCYQVKCPPIEAPCNWPIPERLNRARHRALRPAMARLADAPCLQISGGAALSGTLVAKNFNDRSSIASPLTSSRSVGGAPLVDHELRAVWAYLHTRLHY